MSVVSLRHSRALIWGALAAFVLFVTPAGLPAKASGTAPAGASLAVESGALSGFVYGKDVRTPVAGAVVKIRNIADMKEMASAPTDANGMYAISGVPEGRYLMGVTSAQGDYNLDYALYVKGGELGKLSISLAAVTEGVQSGEAATKKKGFFNSVAGRVLVVAAVGVGLYFLIAGGEEASPIR